jgi:hypothetical protein
MKIYDSNNFVLDYKAFESEVGQEEESPTTQAVSAYESAEVVVEQSRASTTCNLESRGRKFRKKKSQNSLAIPSLNHSTLVSAKSQLNRVMKSG